MDRDIMETFCDEIRDTIIDIGCDLLKTDNFQVFIEQLFTEGDWFFVFLIRMYHSSNICMNQLSIQFITGELLVDIIYRVRFTQTNDETQSSTLFLKLASTNELRRSLLQIHNTFVRETYVYDVVLPMNYLFYFCSKHFNICRRP